VERFAASVSAIVAMHPRWSPAAGDERPWVPTFLDLYDELVPGNVEERVAESEDVVYIAYPTCVQDMHDQYHHD